MAVHLKDYDLLCTFDCRFLTKDETEASLRLATLNFSEPAIRWRNEITRFASSYCDLTRTVSVFKRDDGERRILRTMYANTPYHEEVCSRFDVREGRLLCELASSVAEVAFFATNPFPPFPMKAFGHLVLADAESNRTRLMKICLVDARIKVLEPGLGQITHPSTVRYALLSQSLNEKIAAGVLFINVRVLNSVFPAGELEIVQTTWGPCQIPRALVENLQAMYPLGEYPPHMTEFIYHIDLTGTGQIEGSAIAYIEGLEDKNVDQIIEIVVAGFDILSEPVLKNIYKIIASKVDQFGEEYLSESAERLGFVVRGDD